MYPRAFVSNAGEIAIRALRRNFFDLGETKLRSKSAGNSSGQFGAPFGQFADYVQSSIHAFDGEPRRNAENPG